MRFCRAGIAMLLVAAPLAWSSPASAATSFYINWTSLPANDGNRYSIGIDHVPGGGTYEQFYEAPTSQYNNNPTVPINNGSIRVQSATNLSEVRMEIYSRNSSGNYEPHNGSGGLAIRIPKPFTGTKNLGAIPIPKLGESATGRFVGSIVARDAVTTGRVKVDLFQSTGQKPSAISGTVFDAFSSGQNFGTEYKTGPLWFGQYVAFVTDTRGTSTTADDRQALGTITLSAASQTFDLDLDIPCFGMDECQFSGPAMPNVAGQFHAVGPNRIVDTRIGVGMPVALSSGDGRNADFNPNNRLASRLGHEFRVTGVGGVPATGVSAVLVNVTITQGSNPGSLRLIPKPPRSNWLDDQSSYPASNNQALGTYWNTYDTRATMQLVQVGVGGRVRVHSVGAGSVHFIVDVVGWIDQGQPGQGGDRLIPVDPQRLLDTRPNSPPGIINVGGSDLPFGTNETRALQVTDVAGIPADAKAVIANMTATRSTTRAYQSVWPAGLPRPSASALNTAAYTTRPNMVVSAVSTAGEWSIYNNVAETHLIIDATGYFTPDAGSTGKITAVPSTVLLSSTSSPAGTDRSLSVWGVGDVPRSGVSAVFVLIKASASTGGFVTAYRSGISPVPNVSNVNWIPGQTAVNLALVPVGVDGKIKVYNKTAANIEISILGWVN